MRTNSSGHQLRRLRRLKSLTQAQLGARVGVAWQTVQKWERGDRRLLMHWLPKLARALDCPIEDFLPPPPRRGSD
jgi:transcriptional regulator with XRE-family HTH domain